MSQKQNEPDVHVISDDENDGYEMVNKDDDDLQIIENPNQQQATNNNSTRQHFGESLITIEWRNNTFPLLINLNETTLAQLKRLVELNAKIPMSSQKYLGLHFNNSKPRSEQEYYTLAALGVVPDAVLKLLAPTPEEVAQVQAPPQQQQSSFNSFSFNNNSSSNHGSQLDEDEEMAAAIAASLQDQQQVADYSPQPVAPQRLISEHDFRVPQTLLPQQQQSTIIDDDGDDSDVQMNTTTNQQPSYSIKEHFFGDQKATVDKFIYENCPFDDAFDESKRTHKFLMTILFSSTEDMSLHYCTELLTSDAALEIIKENFILYVADSNNPNVTVQLQSLKRILERNGALGSQFNNLSSNALPITTIVAYMEGSISLVDRIDGYLAVDAVIMKMLQAIEVYGPILETSKFQKQSQSSATPAFNLPSSGIPKTLIDEQNLRYLESLRKDQELIMKKKQEEEDRKRQEEIAQQQLLEAQQKQLAMEQLKAQVAQSLPDEPAPKEKNIATIRLRLPNGQQIERRFRGTETMQVIYDYLWAVHDVHHDKFELFLNFPSKTFSYDECKATTIQDAELCPRAALFVREKF